MAETFEGVAAPDRWGGGYAANIGTEERIASAVTGAAMLGVALGRNNSWRWLLIPAAAGLFWRAATGRCPVKAALRGARPSGGHTSPVSSVARGEGLKVERRIIVDRPAAELYAYWHHLENLPQFMTHLESVTVLDQRRSRWVARAPAGAHVEWDAEIHNDIPDELIAWRSLPGSDVANAGSVHFRPIGDRQATEVQVVLSYEPPAGRLGATIAKLFGEAPGQQVEEDLQRFKQVMETGQGAASEPS